jgi:hypothetical protein
VSSEGPTTVGSINARLTLNADDFERGMRTAGEQADRLDGRNVNVDVHANTAEAIAGLRELEMAENRLRIAQLNLDDANTRGGATEQQRLRAQNALIAAEDRYDRALQARQQAVRDATEAERAAAAATDGSAAATDRDTSSTKQNTDARKSQFSWIQAFLAASPLLLAGADSIAAAAVGMGTSLTIMGAAGAAAIAGIKDEMSQGTVTGQVYTDQLAMLKTGLDQLEQTAAQQFLAQFSGAAEDVNRAMPVLNQLVGEGAQALGNMGRSVVDGLLTGLENMQPLITAGSEALQQFVGWLAGLTADNGFSQFVAYATAQMPGVLHLLESLVTLAGNILAAFAPLGPGVVAVLSGISDVLNALPLPVLAGLVQTALIMPTTFKLAGAAVATFGTEVAGAEGAMTLFGISANLAIPVVGILTAALAGLAIGFMSSAASQQQAIPSANAYADALERDNNAIGENTTKLAEHNLAQAGAYDALGKLGLGYDTLTQAVTGNADALHIVQDAINQANDKYSTAAANAKVSGLKIQQSIMDQKAAADLLGPAMNQTSQAIQQQLHVNQQYAAVSKQATQADIDKAYASQNAADVLGTTSAAIDTATDAQQKQADAAQQAMVKMQLENDAAGILKTTLDGLNGKALSAAQAQNAFDSQLANMGTHVDKVGKTIHFTTNNIGDMSAASVALRGQLNSQVAALEQVVEANGGMSNATGDAKAQMEKMRQQIIDNAVAHGVDRDAVTKYIDKILQIPASVPPTKIEADTAAAEAALARVQAAIAAIHDKTVTITTVNTGGGQNAPGTAGGGMVHANAHGGWAGTGPAYFASGGSASRYARGTDTIPTMLSPGEFTVNATAASRVGAPALDYINRTGQLPPGGGGEPMALTVYVQNPFTGEQVRATVQSVARAEIGAAVRDAAAMRPGLG